MFEDIVVVQSAVSAFNNAALWAPAFLWWGMLATPLFIAIYWCAGTLLNKLGWTRNNILSHVSMWTVVFTFAWIVLFGGNYNVLRDSLSVLPMMVAAIVFLSALFVSSHLRSRPLPRMDWRKRVFVLSVIALVGLSDTHAWWGPLLQIGALLLGVILGRRAKSEMRVIPGTVLIVLMTTTAILMQPEFFRFGQLGNLTIVHLLAVLLLGVCAAIVIAVRNVKSCGKIHRSAYVKLKWLGRVICMLGAALFVLTEAVPVMLGTLVAVCALASLSVWHAKNINPAIVDKMFAMMLGVFGLITVMPVISALGILYWMNTDSVDFWAETKRLL